MNPITFLLVLGIFIALGMVWAQARKETFLASSAINLYNRAHYCLPPNDVGSFEGGCFGIGKLTI